jgi:hypothetical protein
MLYDAPNDVVRNLTELGIAAARLRFARKVGQSEAEWRGALPITSFDMGFFSSVLVSTFAQTEVIEKNPEREEYRAGVRLGPVVPDMAWTPSRGMG